MLCEWDGLWSNGLDGDLLAHTLDVGNNFAINATRGNSENADFWLIYCMRTVHVVKKAFTFKWGTEFDIDNEVVSGYYYQKYGRGEESYVLLKNSEVVFMHAHLVRAVKFLMPPKDHRVNGNDMVYALSDATRQGIMSVISLLEVD